MEPVLSSLQFPLVSKSKEQEENLSVTQLTPTALTLDDQGPWP